MKIWTAVFSTEETQLGTKYYTSDISIKDIKKFLKEYFKNSNYFFSLEEGKGVLSLFILSADRGSFYHYIASSAEELWDDLIKKFPKEFDEFVDRLVSK